MAAVKFNDAQYPFMVVKYHHTELFKHIACVILFMDVPRFMGLDALSDGMHQGQVQLAA